KEGKNYRVTNKNDTEIFKEASNYLTEKRENFIIDSFIDLIPDEPIDPKSVEQKRMLRYGMEKWGDLYNLRQRLSLLTFIINIKRVYKKIIDEGYDENYAKAIITYFGIGIDRLADFGSSLCLWNYTGGRGIKGSFARQALPMIWDYAESNPFNPLAAGWSTACEKIEKWIHHASLSIYSSVNITNSSATALPYPDNFFDAIFTDPPYYDNVNYAELSDFFYVWLKRSVGEIYPDLFSTPLVPKSSEIVANPIRQGNQEKSKKFYEDMLKKSFQEVYRVIKFDGIASIVYAHKSTEGWETLINSLLDSGLIITSAWPLNTEKEGRMNSQETASLASSIYIIARKMTRQPTGFYNEVREELKQYLNKKLHRLWEEGVSGADFFIAAIGSAIEVFGKYEKVMDYEGNIIRADRMLEDIRKFATDYAVKQILHNGFAGEITDLTRFYVLSRWNYGEAKVPFDEARKLAQSCGIDLSKEWGKGGFIKKDKEFIKVFGPQDRDVKSLKDSTELIDVLHKVLLLWEKSKRDDMIELLKDSGYGKSEAFFRVAQAISETLALDSKEKKLLDGFLAGRERLSQEMKKETGQGKLF
ncbi:MAG: DNA methylase, partial [Candidatus Eremiobacterota bacterium]